MEKTESVRQKERDRKGKTERGNQKKKNRKRKEE